MCCVIDVDAVAPQNVIQSPRSQGCQDFPSYEQYPPPPPPLKGSSRLSLSRKTRTHPEEEKSQTCMTQFHPLLREKLRSSTSRLTNKLGRARPDPAEAETDLWQRMEAEANLFLSRSLSLRQIRRVTDGGNLLEF